MSAPTLLDRLADMLRDMSPEHREAWLEDKARDDREED